MRLSLNLRDVAGPYGGANQFAINLQDHLQKRGHQVVRRLVPDLDVIVIVSSQYYPLSTAFTIEEVADYAFRHPNTVVLHRINTCDEQRGRDLGTNRAVLNANRLADHTVFVSDFIRDLYAARGLETAGRHTVILNGANDEIFHPRGRAEWKAGERLRIVTHHWSDNFMKGFDVYERLDALLEREPIRDLFEFTIIGNVPLGVSFRNSRIERPLLGEALASALRGHHLYVTAARNEPGGNHPIEAMRCGLPILYLGSGSLPQYCSGYGVEFSLTDFDTRLLEAKDRFPELHQAVLSCPRAASAMAAEYERLLEGLVADRRASPRPRPTVLGRCGRAMRRGKRLLDRWRRRMGHLSTPKPSSGTCRMMAGA